jgi:hypothetical protein
MLNYSSNIFHTDILFLQPDLSCSLSCPSCYVHEAAKHKGLHMKRYLMQDLLHDVLYLQDNIITDQFTIALNDIVDEDYHSWWWPVVDAVTMPGRVLPAEFHATVNNLRGSVNNPYHIASETFFNKLTMLSVSHLTPESAKSFKERKLSTKLNWNVFSDEVEKISDEKLIAILQLVDHVYIIMKKPPLGLTYVNEYANSVSSLERTIRRLTDMKTVESKAFVPVDNACKVPSIFDKIHIDGCFKDSNKYNRTGNGCSSNISRFQIWPDGTATGCAYNSQQSYEQKSAISLSGIVVNLKKARTRYEFSSCKIPQLLSSKVNKLRVIS